MITVKITTPSLLLFILSASPAWSAGNNRFPSFREWRGQNQLSPELRSTVVATGPAVQGGKLHVLIGIRNASKRPILFSYAMENPWIRQYGYVPVPRDKDDFRLGGGVVIGGDHVPMDNQQVCHVPGRVYMLKPGAEMYRDAELELSEAPVGRVRLSVEYDLVRVSPGAGCERASLYRGRGEAVVDIRAASRNP